ncbi:carbohydrate binding family 9 domain-containing protein [Myxococcota bacterium]|nr:carbohydrate binding family 9 domain-containing protein [Myxococcota bacterium]
MQAPVRTALGILCATSLVLGSHAYAKDVPRVRAVHVEEGPVIDGLLDDPVWTRANSIDEMIQVIPISGGEPSERTVARFLTDGEFLYIGIRAYDRDPESLVARRMKRDDFFFFDDNVGVSIDPFRDGLNGYFFQVNPNGGRREVSFEGHLFEKDWNGVWYAKANIDDAGYTVEMAIPFQSISFDPSLDAWGMNVSRIVGRSNEWIRWNNPRPDEFVSTMSKAGILEGMATAEQGWGLDIVPSGTVRRIDDNDTGEHEFKFKPSVDAFYKLTPSLTASLTINTDFGETEVDDQRVNLTRFALFYPEKRDFFLQDSGIFEFAELKGQNGIPFFSRRIGLDPAGNPVDILAGAKVTGRIGRFKLGVLNVETEPHADIGYRNLSVVRVAANVLTESTVGMIATLGNQDGAPTDGLVGFDAIYRNRNFIENRTLKGKLWVQRSINEGAPDDQWAFGGDIEYPNDRIFWKVGAQELQSNFLPALGFVNRVGIRQYDGIFRHRIRQNGFLRTLDSSVEGLLITGLSNDIESARIAVNPLEFTSSINDRAEIIYEHRFERLIAPFEIQPGVIIPPGSYPFDLGMLLLQSAPTRALQAGVEISYGTFFSGRRLRINPRLAWRPSPHLFVELVYDQNDVNLPEGDFVTRVARLRVDVNFSPNLAWANFIQWDNVSDELSINSRLFWVPVEGREVFIVFNQYLDTSLGDIRLVRTEPLAKLGWLLRF